jgi:hypothetical protein
MWEKDIFKNSHPDPLILVGLKLTQFLVFLTFFRLLQAENGIRPVLVLSALLLFEVVKLI